MLPYNHTPECQKMYITVAKKADPKDKANVMNVKGNKLKKVILNCSSIILKTCVRQWEVFTG